MKKLTQLVVLFFITSTASAQIVYVKKGFAVEGYDVVAYFSNEAIKGNNAFVVTNNGINYKFSTAENAEKFKQNPTLYKPQYGGFCAYAIALKGKKVSVNPKTFQIIDNKLYLFYNSWGTNTLDKWNEEGADVLKNKADANWKIIMEGR